MIGYIPIKVRGSTERAIATVLIPEDAITNIDRDTIKCRDTALYRTDKLLTQSIILPDGSNYEKGETIYEEHPFRFIVNKYTIDTHYNHNKTVEICLSGLHFFLDKQVAELYGIRTLKDGTYKKWYSNGQAHVIGEFKNNKPEGEWYTFYPNSVMQSYTLYENGKEEGISKFWYETGHLYTQIEYCKGKMHGVLTRWCEDGSIMYIEHYRKGVCLD